MKEGIITVMKVDSAGKPVQTFADRARESRKNHFNPLPRRVFGFSNKGIIRQSRSFSLCAKYVIAAAKIEAMGLPESEKSGMRVSWDKEVWSVANKDEHLAITAAIESLKSRFGDGWFTQVLEFRQAASKTGFGDSFMGAPSKPKRLAREVTALVQAMDALGKLGQMGPHARRWEASSIFRSQSPLVQGLIATELEGIKPES